MVRPSYSQPLNRGRHRQQGAAAVYAAGAIVGMVASMALAVDIGQLYYAQRDLQKLAASAAADAARAFSGCYAHPGVPGSFGSITSAVTASITANLANRLAGDVVNASQVMQDYGQGVATVEVGTFQRATINGVSSRTFAPQNVNSPAVDSVQVNLARIAPTPLIPFPVVMSGAAPITLHASAAAQQSPAASYSLTTTLANINNPAPICSLLGGSGSACLGVSAVGANGLANATLTLNGLAATLGVASAGDLLSTTLSTNTLLQGIADTVANTVNSTSSTAQSEAATLLSSLAAVAGTAQVNVGTLLGDLPSSVGDQIGDMPINAQALLTQLSMAASAGLYPIKLAVSPLNIPGVTVDAFLTLGANPGVSNSTSDDSSASRLGLGRPGIDANGNERTSASIQQLTLLLRIGISTANLPALGAVVGNAGTLNIGIDVTGASATSFLATMNCPAPLSGSNIASLTIPVTSNAATVAIGTYNPANETQPVTKGNALTIAGNLVTVTLPPPTPISLGSGSDTKTFTAPFDSTNPDNSQTVGPTDATLQTALNSLYGPLGSTITVSVNTGLPVSVSAPISGTALVTALSPYLNMVAADLDPTIKGLGVSLGGATVTLTGAGFGTHAGDTAAMVSNNSAPVIFDESKPGYEIPVQTPNSSSTR